MPNPNPATPPRPTQNPGDLLLARVAVLAERMSTLLPAGALGKPTLDFLAGVADEHRAGSTRTSAPLQRLLTAFSLTPLDLDLLALAGLPEEHEGFASLMSQLHPRAEPHATVALAAQLLAPTRAERTELLRRCWASPLVTTGILGLSKDGPLPTRSLQLCEALWPALRGIDAWPRELVRDEDPVIEYGLAEWAASQDAALAVAALRRDSTVTVLVHADDEAVASARAAALVRAAGREPLRVLVSEKTPSMKALACVHALLRGAVPVLTLSPPEGPARTTVPELRQPGTVVVCARTGAAVAGGHRPVIPVACTRLSTAALRQIWEHALPELKASSSTLAARYPIEPAAADELAKGLAHQVAALARPMTLADVSAWIRARGGTVGGTGVKIVHPTAGWGDLVLPPDRLAALHDAVDRVRLQARVLDDWGFLAGRSGARGVRMLFCGPPGTGKTLSAEVLARALETDLFVIDVSRVVSKWIGETEKNLAEAFDAGERACAVLLFDEADALFGKRTEVADAHDRYANLETAYLLSRVERYEGLVILTSNLRQNIDIAFMRRMEFVVEFEAPGRDERAALWRCHVPAGAPVGSDVSWDELAILFPVVGGVIRNAAVAAAFLAAAEDVPISRAHLVRALRREYEKAGKALPGIPRETPEL